MGAPEVKTPAEIAAAAAKPKPRFVHLHVHSHYSLLNALPQIPDLVKAAKKRGFDSLALTDNGNLYGAVEFFQQCKKNEIKPILGIDAYVAARTRNDKQHGIDSKRSRLILLAKTTLGYKNLIKVVTDSHLEGFYYKPRVDAELLAKYPEDLICILPSFTSETSFMLKLEDFERAELIIEKYRKIYGKENVYLEVTRHAEIPNHEELMAKVIELGKRTGTPLVAAHDVYYIEPEDRLARDTLISISAGGSSKDDSEAKPLEESEEDFSLISPEKAEKLFKDIPEALDNARKIADMCNAEIQIGKWYFPAVVVPEGVTHDEVLRGLVMDGLVTRKLELTPEVSTRIEYELGVIKTKGYANYFLTVTDLLRFAHENDILTTIRGSVAGSLVTYLAHITNVNPIEYKLPFERFLNPERPSAPDIDMDYADDRRDEVIAYARKKYGPERVAQIGTFGTMMARGAVRDTTRALGFPHGLGDQIAKLIPMGMQGKPMTIDKAMEDVAELTELYKKDADVKRIMDMARKIEGCARHISVHAAGVVIAPDSLVAHTPLQFDPKGEGKLITQYDMHAVGEDGVGLLKFDFLGIRNLAILADAVKRVKKVLNVDVDIENVPVDDKKTFEMLARGETTGLFQLNGGGMTRSLMELKPSVIHDINVMVALYRPGPMDNIQEYIARKHGKKPAVYAHPKMKEFLATTFGVLVYQDDLLMTAIEVAGYTWGEVDKFRKAVGKKIPEEMAKQHVIFVDGCVKHGGMLKADAEKIWDLFEPFQGYGFNKAHAASYGKVAYQTAYMKANFPALYMSAVLTAESGDTDTVAEVIAECKRMKIPVLPPDVNESFEAFTVVTNAEGKDQIRFGLSTIKNFGEGISHALISERAKGGHFKSIADFLDRIKDRNLNRKSMESLIKAGAFDAFGERGQLLANLDDLLAYNKEHGKVENQDSLFGSLGVSTPGLRMREAPPAPAKEKLAWEKELLGLYISGHPLDAFKEKLATKVGIAEIKAKVTAGTLKEKDLAVISGIIEELKPLVTKKGDPMAFMKLTDLTGSMEVVVFPKSLELYKGILIPEACISLKGKISQRNGEISMLTEAVKAL